MAVVRRYVLLDNEPIVISHGDFTPKEGYETVTFEEYLKRCLAKRKGAK